MRYSSFIFVCLALMALCTGCTPKAVVPISDLAHYEHPPIALKLASVEIETLYEPSFRAPDIEHQFSPTLLEEITRWKDSNLKAIGGEHRLQLIIHDAAVKEIAQPSSSPFSHRYDSHIALEARIYGSARLMSESSLEVEVTQQHSLPKGATSLQRKQLFTLITHDIMHALDEQMRHQIARYFARYHEQGE